MEIWDFLQSINETKVDIWQNLNDEEKKIYNPFIVNKSLSFFIDTVIFANEMNKFYNLDKDMQYQFLLNIIKRKKRYSKWHKKVENDKLDLVKKFFKYDDRKAIDALSILSDDQIEYLKTQQKIINGNKK